MSTKGQLGIPNLKGPKGSTGSSNLAGLKLSLNDLPAMKDWFRKHAPDDPLLKAAEAELATKPK